MITISQNSLKLIKNFVLIGIILPTFSFAAITYQIQNKKNQKISLRLALTLNEHSRGLSGLRENEFSNKEGMLFINNKMDNRKFWMPNTYFNLDIIFLDKDLIIVGIEKNAPMHPGMTEPPLIYRTKSYYAQFVLETKTNIAFSKNLAVGDKLKWISPISLSEIILKIHQPQ